MQRIKKFSMILGLLLFTLMGLYAQPPGGGRGSQLTEEDIEKRVESNAKTLELTKDQEEKYLAVELDFYNKMQIERQKMRNADPPPDREEMRTKMRSMRDAHDKQLKEIFTEEQFEKFKKMQEQRRSEMQKQRQEQTPDRQERGRGRR